MVSNLTAASAFTFALNLQPFDGFLIWNNDFVKLRNLFLFNIKLFPITINQIGQFFDCIIIPVVLAIVNVFYSNFGKRWSFFLVRFPSQPVFIRKADGFNQIVVISIVFFNLINHKSMIFSFEICNLAIQDLYYIS